MSQPAFAMAPIILAIVLVVSAVAKWNDKEATRSSIMLLRLPKALQAPWVASALPIGEIALAAVMTGPFGPLVPVAAVIAVALFVTYLAVIARAMTFTPRPSCGCFGRIGDQRVNGKTVARNALFVVLALVFLVWAWAGHTVPNALSQFAARDWWWLVAALTVGTVTVFVAGMAPARTPKFTPPAAAPPVTPPAPPARVPAARDAESEQETDPALDYVRLPIPLATVTAPSGQQSTLRELTMTHAQLLIFVNCHCASTHNIAADVEGWMEQLPQIEVRLVFSYVSTLPGLPERVLENSLRDHGGVAWSYLDLRGDSPAAVLLGADGLLAGGPVHGIEDVRAFVADVAAELAEAGN